MYNPKSFEQKWRNVWKESEVYKTNLNSDKPKHYAVTMFPYPSGNLHVGHWYAVAIPDTRARYMRMNGYNVFFPMGFDSFGLPAENAAIKHKIDPKKWTYDNISYMTDQFEKMGTIIDWENTLITSDPEYYKWNQWLFIQFFKRGLAYKKESFVNWDPIDQTVLANEQVIDGRGERSGALVERRLMNQWHLRITDYAEELLNFDGLNWPERVKTMQTNWIGKSLGAEIDFPTQMGTITVFTTRPDTVFGATFLVLAPEHPLVRRLTTEKQHLLVEKYIEQCASITEIDRQSESRERTGIWLGSFATNPLTNEQIPIWIADYVLVTYGTGAVMAVPAHDQRDFELATKYSLPIKVVIQPKDGFLPEILTQAYIGNGLMVNSGEFDGALVGKDRIESIIERLKQQEKARPKTTYRLRDWLISRQRYWGTPIPIIYCDKCGTQTVSEDQLPVILPENVEFLPTGQSPLTIEEWKNCTCPNCRGAATRETDTMDTFVDSSWYFYRYLSPNKTDSVIDNRLVNKWLPVDWYTGGIEHAILHLLYARFWTKAMRDLGLVDIDEPFKNLMNQGMILGEDDEKMSKSRGNVVDPDDLVLHYGSDSVRTYLQFIGPWDQGGPWDPNGITGVYNWLKRIWSLFNDKPETGQVFKEQDLEYAINFAIKKVGEDTENFRFNTAIAAMMELSNTLGKAKRSDLYGTNLWNEALRSFNLILAPYAPHLAEELWHLSGNDGSVHSQSWPKYDQNKLKRDTFELVIQVSGKLRGRIEAPIDINQQQALELAKENAQVRQFIDGKEIIKEIYVPGKLLNIVVK